MLFYKNVEKERNVKRSEEQQLAAKEINSGMVTRKAFLVRTSNSNKWLTPITGTTWCENITCCQNLLQ